MKQVSDGAVPLLAGVLLAAVWADGCTRSQPPATSSQNPLTHASQGRPSSGSPPPDVPTLIRVTGDERLAWEHDNIERVSPAALRFRAYVDNVPVPFSDVSCLGKVGATYECVAPLPVMSEGPHSLRLSTIREVQGVLVESARSTFILLMKDTSGLPAVRSPRNQIAAGLPPTR